MTDEQAKKEAGDIAEISVLGTKAVRKAGADASEKMGEIVRQYAGKESRLKIINEHAFELGVAEGFIDNIVPIVSSMPQDLRARGCSEAESQVLTWLFLANVLKNLK